MKQDKYKLYLWQSDLLLVLGFQAVNTQLANKHNLFIYNDSCYL